MTIKSIDQKFTSANSVPVERAGVTREEWGSARAITEGLAEALEQLMQLEARDRIMPIGREWDKARDSMAKYKEAKQ